MNRGGNTPDEFSIINELFAPLAGPEGLRLQDDAALFQPRSGCELVLTKDAIAEGRHYFADDPPDLIARKLLRMNLSDLAAKGAHPVGYLLACAWGKDVNLDWIAKFADGLSDDQDRYGIRLFGGDTVRTDGGSVFSLTAIGEVPAGQMVRRAGARAGEQVYVTGSLGDAALGLQIRLGQVRVGAAEARAHFEQAYLLPDPPSQFGAFFGEFATAALDVSDGLIADAGHLGAASGVTLVVRQERLPMSAEGALMISEQPDLWPQVTSGGDDYQILFTASPDREPQILELAARCGVRVTQIGEVVPKDGRPVRLLDREGHDLPVTEGGFSHF